jgi:peptidoglycan/xylan/chitin deacetylase (PgdA/CDA1 family)
VADRRLWLIGLGVPSAPVGRLDRVLRSSVKRGLGALVGPGRAVGSTILIYHRVGGGTGDELDLPVDAFAAQLDALVDGGHDVVSLDAALDRLDAGDDRPAVVLTFDDGFADVHHHAFPLLKERGLPFTLYLAAGLVGEAMAWEGSSADSQGSAALTWDEVAEMAASGLCTVANHTFTHAGPEAVDVEQLDRCSGEIEARTGQRPSHFAWTWGVPVPALLPAVRERFRSAATGELGRNLPDTDRHALRRVPVRASDPLPFFRAKLTGNLGPERAYARIVRTAKAGRRVVRRG